MPIDYVVEVSAEVQSTTKIRLVWPTTGITGAITVFRRNFGSKPWGTAVATLTKTDAEYIDSTIITGTLYEYQVQATKGTTIAYGYITSGTNLPLEDARGSLLLLVDDTMATPLVTELDRLELDLIGDGWTVVRKDVNRTAKPSEIKVIIQAAITADPNIKSLFLFGHIPVLRSGWFAPDGHASRAWPADVYYGDFTGTWTDTLSDTNNKPGDGVFDQTQMPADVTLQIGRVDLWNLSQITKTETELLRQYLDKDHNFRHGQIATQNKGLCDDNFGSYGEGFAQNAFRNFSTFFGAGNTDTTVDWKAAQTTPYLWAYGTGAGSYTSCNGVANTADMNTADPGVFTMLFGSYFGEWDSANNILRAALATPTNGLTCTWAGRPHWAMHPMAMGKTIGLSAMLSQNNNYGGYSPANFGTRQVHIALMGDPSLRMHPVAPPTNVKITVNGNSAKIDWTASTDTVLGYNVYRTNVKKGTYTKVNTNLITGVTYTDNAKPANAVAYMVRAIKLQTSSSGTYNNISQGAYVDVNGTATPTVSITPAAGTYTTAQTVTMTIANGANGDVIRYTTDGSAPLASSNLYSVPISVATTTTVRAQVFRSGAAQGTAVSEVYTITQAQSAVTTTPAAGSYSNSVTVTLTGGTTGDEIRYTTNNSNPTATSTLYSTPIVITTTTTIRAQIFNAGVAKGQVMTALYTITLPSSLTLTPASGTYANFVAVTISGAPNGATIRYTLDGTNPTTTSTISAGQVTILSSKKLIAQAFVNGVASGQPVIGDYVITVGVPTFSPAPGTYTTAKLVTISKGANNGVIHYTLDGSDPTVTSPAYSTAINVTATTTITARLFNGNTISAPATGLYTINNNTPANGVDLVIKTSTGRSVGEGIVSTTGNQIATVSVPTKRNANYSIVIKNTGSTADSYYVNSNLGQVNWKISYYTIEGTSITKAITGAHWQTPTIQPGKSYEIRLDVTPASGLLTGQSSLSLNITATAVSNATITDMVTAETLVSKIKQ
ncbi:MAG: chitobiase/beta-hexosaminidase C-terminal domain-containing protein [bacterium]